MTSANTGLRNTKLERRKEPVGAKSPALSPDSQHGKPSLYGHSVHMQNLPYSRLRGPEPDRGKASHTAHTRDPKPRAMGSAPYSIRPEDTASARKKGTARGQTRERREARPLRSRIGQRHPISNIACAIFIASWQASLPNAQSRKHYESVLSCCEAYPL